MLTWFPEGALIAAATAGVLAYGTFAPRSSLFGPVISRGRSSDAVALTFDDGPCPGATEAILDILARERIHATFFVIGRYAAQHRSLCARMHAEGHLLANHTFDHSRIGMFKGRRYWLDQIQRTSDVINDVTGAPPAFFRPPMGFKAPPVMRAAQHAGCRVVTWTRRALDGVRTPPESIVRRLAQARPGEILMLHDGRDPASRRPFDATIQALPQVIAALRQRNIQMHRLDQLLNPP